MILYTRSHWEHIKGVCKTSLRVNKDLLNPLSPGVLDPGNYPGGPQDPQLYFAFFGFFMPPSINVKPHIGDNN